MPLDEIPVGWHRWESQLKQTDDKCLAFTEDTCRAVARQHGFKAANVRWEPHNWEGADRTPHEWHITADFESAEGYAQTAHIYTSSGSPEWRAERYADGTIKAVFQKDMIAKRANRWGNGRSQSMPELRSTPKPFELAPLRKTNDAFTAKSWRRSTISSAATVDSWRMPRRLSLPEVDKPRKDVTTLASWR